MTETHRYRARWVFPVSSEPIENGLVEIVGDRITAVSALDDPSAIDLGNAAIVPGLVNAHVHLEFSMLAEPLQPALPFTSWIRSLMGYRATRGVSVSEAVKAGRSEAGRSGTAVLGEIATEGWSPEGFASAGPRAVVFRELIGLTPERIEQSLQLAHEHLDAPLGERCRAGLSPHAPYSVHAELFEEIVRLAAASEVPVAVHLAETRAELELLAHGTGEFATMLREFGIWNDDLFASPRTPLDFLQLMEDVPRGLVVHGNHLSEAERAFVAARPHLAVVYCPRTHAFFGHDRHPWRDLLRDGGSVALGTDGRGSNPDLDLWREMSFLAVRSPDVPPRTILELGTINGARALGLEGEFGTLEPGKRASFTVVGGLGEVGSDPHRSLFKPGGSIVATFLDGVRQPVA